ncbi:type IV pilus biogenesis/stability protein PilW [Arenimonas fontis]|nr:type IV pilus biogenesis/stability protein PilW [Arenimonas fontis]
MPPDAGRAFLAVLLAALLAACAGTGGATPATGGRGAEMSRQGNANLRLAQSYLQSGKLEYALDRARRGLQTDPDSADLHVVMGMIQERINQPARAGESYARAARLAPGSGHVRNAYAVWLCQQGRHDQAETQFAAAFADPFYGNKHQAYYNAGRCAWLAGRPTVAETHLRKGLDLAPEDAALLLLAAEVEYANGDYLSARAFLQRREAAGASTPELLDLAARIEEAAGDRASADRYRQRLRQQFPDFTPTAPEGARQQ